ncbi:MAG: adenylate/guanylate cyclase domain-containing protein [Thermodesulfobacteriota bacterium]
MPAPPPSPERPGPGRRLSRARLPLIQIGANLTGAVLCFVYFTFVEPDTIIVNLDQLTLVVALMSLAMMGCGFWFTQRWRRHMFAAAGILLVGGRPEPAELAQAQRDALNGPLFYSLLSMTLWTVAALIMTFYSVAVLPAGVALKYELGLGARIFLGTLVSGLATASIVFFAVDRYFRRLRPLLFPDGGLVRVSGVFRLPLKRRLMFTFFMVGVGPMIVMTVMVTRIAMGTMVRDPSVGVDNLLHVIFYLLAASMAAALLLSRLVGQSISEPARELEKAIARVEAGDLSVRVPVSDNDELGVLSDSFNQMTAGLAERERIKEAFGRFVTPAIAKAILANPPRPGGASTEVTVLFSDIRSYTRLSERMSPAEVIAFLNAYFSHMVPAIEKHQGLVYQFVGDAIMAVFNAPLATPDHATLAVRAGLEMLGALERFNAARGGPPVKMGIGVHSGPVVAGIIGSQDRMEYRVVGDTVNLAARVEGLTKELGAPLIISQATRDGLSQDFALSDLGSHAVKGRVEPVQVFAVQAGPAVP